MKKYTKDFTNLTTEKVTGKGIVEEKEEKEIVREKMKRIIIATLFLHCFYQKSEIQ